MPGEVDLNEVDYAGSAVFGFIVIIVPGHVYDLGPCE
jgi:hypothetical protein